MKVLLRTNYEKFVRETELHTIQYTIKTWNGQQL